MLPTSASFLVTENCNLACKYCFEHHNDKVMTEEVAYAGLEFLSENAIKNKQREFHAMLFGGEPLLNIKLIDKIFHKGEEIAKAKGLRFTTSLVTNATVMNDEIYDVLKWHKNSSNLTIQLSIDGAEESQNLYRVTKAGKGSFDMVEKNIKKFKSLFEVDLYKLCVHGCVNKQTLPKMYENFTYFREKWGIENIWFLPIMEEKWDENDVKIYDEQQGKITKYIKDLIEQTKDINKMNIYAPMDKCMNTMRASKPCGAGDSFITITAEGDMYPCHQIYFNNPDKSEHIGNVLDGKINEDIRKKYVEYNSACMDCPSDCEMTNCYRCIAVNFQVNNKDFLKQVKGLYCDLMKVDKKYQDELREHIIKLGLIQNNAQNNEDNCLCNSRKCSGGNYNGCDIVNRQEVCESGNNPYNPGCMCDVDNNNGMPYNNQYGQPQYSRDFEETCGLAFQVILQKLNDLQKEVEKINENIRPKN